VLTARAASHNRPRERLETAHASPGGQAGHRPRRAMPFPLGRSLPDGHPVPSRLILAALGVAVSFSRPRARYGPQGRLGRLLARLAWPWGGRAGGANGRHRMPVTRRPPAAPSGVPGRARRQGPDDRQAISHAPG